MTIWTAVVPAAIAPSPLATYVATTLPLPFPRPFPNTVELGTALITSRLISVRPINAVSLTLRMVRVTSIAVLPNEAFRTPTPLVGLRTLIRLPSAF